MQGLLEQFWDNFRHNLFKPLLLFFYMGFSVPLLRVPFEFPHVIYQGLTIYLLVAIGWHGGEELAALDAHDLAQAGGFMVIGFITNFIIGCLAYFILRGATRLRQIDAATVAGYYGSDSAGTFVTCVGVLLASGIPYAAYMPVMLAVMEIPGCLVALYLVSRLRHKNMDALGNMPSEPGYDPHAVAAPRETAGEHGGHAPAPAHSTAGNRKSMFNWQLLHEVFLNPGLFLLFGGIVIGFVSELQRKHADVAVVEIETQGDVHTISVVKEGEKLPSLNGEASSGATGGSHDSLSNATPGDAKAASPAASRGKKPSIFVLPLQKARDVAKKVGHDVRRLVSGRPVLVSARDGHDGLPPAARSEKRRLAIRGLRRGGAERVRDRGHVRGPRLQHRAGRTLRARHLRAVRRVVRRRVVYRRSGGAANGHPGS